MMRPRDCEYKKKVASGLCGSEKGRERPRPFSLPVPCTSNYKYFNPHHIDYDDHLIITKKWREFNFYYGMEYHSIYLKYHFILMHSDTKCCFK